MPFFSIIIPSYNRAHIVGKAIKSILVQSFSDFEIIVVDDGSTDNTAAVVKEFNDEERVFYHKKSNSGVSDTRNVGASFAKGSYIIFLDSDDVLTDDALTHYHQTILAEQADIVYGDMILVNALNNSTQLKKGRNPYGNNEAVGIYIPGAFCLSKNLFFDAGCYDKHIKFGENAELKFRIYSLPHKFAFVDKPVLIYESSADGGSKNLYNKIDSNTYIIEKHPDFFQKNPRVLRFYLQDVAVAYARLSQWKKARKYFFKAYLVNLKKTSTFIRFLFCLFPPIAKKIWKK